MKILTQVLYKSTILTGSMELSSIISSTANHNNAKIQPLFKIMSNPPELLSKEELSMILNQVTMAFMHNNMPPSSRHTLTTIPYISSI